MRKSLGSMASLAMMAATMASLDSEMKFATEETNSFIRRKNVSMQSTIAMTKKQLKARSKNKRAKIARRINRN